MAVVNELDVDFEIVAVDANNAEVPVVPRLPNIVSRRGHRVKITAFIHNVPRPDRTTRVNLSAVVNVLESTVMGKSGDTSRPFQRWGSSTAPKTATIPANTFPNSPPVEVFVIAINTGGDDHLGQGPDYQAEATITTESLRFTPSEERGETTDEERANTTEEELRDNSEPEAAAPRSARTPRINGVYNIPFTAK